MLTYVFTFIAHSAYFLSPKTLRKCHLSKAITHHLDVRATNHTPNVINHVTKLFNSKGTHQSIFLLSVFSNEDKLNQWLSMSPLALLPI